MKKGGRNKVRSGKMKEKWKGDSERKKEGEDWRTSEVRNKVNIHSKIRTCVIKLGLSKN